MWTIVVTALIVWGMHARLERYITPQEASAIGRDHRRFDDAGAAVVFGRVNASLCAGWRDSRLVFEFHMVLGVVGRC